MVPALPSACCAVPGDGERGRQGRGCARRGRRGPGRAWKACDGGAPCDGPLPSGARRVHVSGGGRHLPRLHPPATRSMRPCWSSALAYVCGQLRNAACLCPFILGTRAALCPGRPAGLPAHRHAQLSTSLRAGAERHAPVPQVRAFVPVISRCIGKLGPGAMASDLWGSEDLGGLPPALR